MVLHSVDVANVQRRVGTPAALSSSCHSKALSVSTGPFRGRPTHGRTGKAWSIPVADLDLSSCSSQGIDRSPFNGYQYITKPTDANIESPAGVGFRLRSVLNGVLVTVALDEAVLGLDRVLDGVVRGDLTGLIVRACTRLIRTGRLLHQVGRFHREIVKE